MKAHHIALFVLVAAAAGLPGQSASSKTFFLAASEQSSGGRCDSTTYKMVGSLGSGVSAARATSPRYVLQGGFAAILGAKTKGKPILTAVTPGEGPLLGGTALTLHGTELDLGVGASVKIGGQTATITRRTRDAVRVNLPKQVQPGPRAVELTTPAGVAMLPAGIEVLPLVELPRPPRNQEPFVIRYRGATGDQVVFAVALQRFATPIFRMPPFHYGLTLNPTSMAAFPALAVTSPSGVFDLRVPAVDLVSTVYVQAFCVTRDAGWLPGSFTNTIRF